MLHKWTTTSAEKLKAVFSKTDIRDLPALISKRFPFFFDFQGKSPLDLALEAYDIKAFTFLAD